MKSIEEVIELFQDKKQERLFLIDHFPMQIKSNEKLVQLEQYKNHMYLKKPNSKRSWLQFFAYLWLYFDVSMYIFNEKKGKPQRRNSSQKDQFQEMCQVKPLLHAVKEIVQGKATAYFIMHNQMTDHGKTYLFFDGENALVHSDDTEAVNLISLLSSSCNMYMRAAPLNKAPIPKND